MNNKKYGFTLGEILMGVLIVGVIAVLTIPSLLKNIQAKSRMSLLKGTIANVSNSIQVELTKQRTTEIKSTDIYNNPKKFLETFDIATAGEPFASSYKKYSGLTNASGVLIPKNGVNGQAVVLLKNGVGLGIINTTNDAKTTIVIDVTGNKAPNIVGADYFILQIKRSSGNGHQEGDLSSFENGGAGGAESSANLKSSCKGGNGAACYRLVELSAFSYDYLK